jgi:polysaccharide biosynthesis PFTS motif protein
MKHVHYRLDNVARLLSAPFRSLERNQIRMMMRGYRSLKQAGKLHIIEDSVQYLREYQLHIPSTTLPKSLWGQASNSAELIIRQLLSSRYLNLTRALLIGSSKPNAKIIAPFPKVWRVQLERLGFPIDHSRSAVAWNLYLIKNLCYGIAKAFVIIRGFFIATTSGLNKRGNYIYFCDLDASNIPASQCNSSTRCIISWYIRWSGRRHDIDSLRHSVPDASPLFLGPYHVSHQSAPIPSLDSIGQQFAFVFWIFLSLAHQLLSCFKGYWWNVLIYQESVSSFLVRIQSTSFAKEYWFHNSRLYPPLWVYELPLKGSRCVYYFYSTNTETFLFRKDGTRPFITPYSLMNWPEYLVWDIYQHSFVMQCCNTCSSIKIVGPIAFSEYSSISPLGSTCDSLPSIAVFDVQPVRDSSYQGLGIASDFYIPDYCIAFLSDLIICAAQLNLNLLIKKKRDIGRTAHPKYRNFLASISAQDHITLVDPGVSPATLVQNAIASISMPFTSAAIISREAGLPSVYYLPAISCGVDYSLSHGISVIDNTANLRLWMQHVVLSRP